LLDVKGQLQFIGLENIDEMFQDFRRTVLLHIREKQPKQNNEATISCERRRFGHFMFLMRAVMIRHSQQQQYRGTSTTLMSLPPKVGNRKDWSSNEQADRSLMRICSLFAVNFSVGAYYRD
jgi:hypothetical protein